MYRVLALVLAACLIRSVAFAQTAEPQYNVVSLTAQADREVPNDLMSAVLAAQFDGPESAPLAEKTNRVMREALNTVRAYRSVQARSGNYLTTPQYKDGQITGWRVRQELRMESQDFAAITELVGKLQPSLLVASIVVSVSPEARRKAENGLIAEAIAAFEERARIVRDAMKMKDSRVRQLNISGSGPVYPPVPVPYAAASVAAAPRPAPAPAVEAGTTRILITVSGTVQLQ